MLLEFSICAKFLGAIVLTGAIASLLRDTKMSHNKLAISKFEDYRELERLTGDYGFILSKLIQLNKQASSEHVLILGATGSRKTTSVFYPNRDTKAFQESIGRETIIFSPLNDLNAKYNLLKECISVIEIRELAQAILLNAIKSLELKTGSKASGIEWINRSLLI